MVFGPWNNGCSGSKIVTGAVSSCDAPTDGRRPQLDGIWRQILRPIACRRVVLHDNISAVTNILQQAIIVFKEIFPAEVSAYADDDRVILRTSLRLPGHLCREIQHRHLLVVTPGPLGQTRCPRTLLLTCPPFEGERPLR